MSEPTWTVADVLASLNRLDPNMSVYHQKFRLHSQGVMLQPGINTVHGFVQEAKPYWDETRQDTLSLPVYDSSLHPITGIVLHEENDSNAENRWIEFVSHRASYGGLHM